MSWSYPLLSTHGVSLPAGAGPELARRMRRAALPAALLSLALLATLPAPASAFEVRKGDEVTIAAGETIDETLIAFGETVQVNGRVDGDLVVFGRQVAVRGEVDGNVYAFSQSLDLEGPVAGAAVGFTQWARITGAVAGNGYFMGQNVRLLSAAGVDGDVLMAGELVSLEGRVGRDLAGFGRKLTVSGTVGRDVLSGAEEVVLTPTANLGGDLTTYLPREENLQVADGARVAGTTEVEVAQPRARRSRYARPGFYLWRAIGLAGAFLVGALLYFALPGFYGDRPRGATAVLLRLALGFGLLVAVPVALLLAGITLVGLPIALLGLVLYLAALYLAQIAVADWLGRSLLKPEGAGTGKTLAALLLGLAILLVAGLLPWIGGWIRFLVLLAGLGMLAFRVRDAWRAGRAPAAAA